MKTPPPVKIPVIFDLDGTLIHSAPDIHAAVNAMLAAEGQPALDLATVTGFIGNGLAVLVRRVMDHLRMDSADHARLTAATLVQMKASPAGLTRPYPGTIEVLATLRAAGHPIGLCTNKPEEAAIAVLAGLGLDRAFDVVVGGGRLSVLKPDPAPLLLAMQELGAKTALYVGDSEVDAETADRAGLPFLIFTGGYRKTPVADLPHTASFDDFAELVALVEQFG